MGACILSSCATLLCKRSQYSPLSTGLYIRSSYLYFTPFPTLTRGCVLFSSSFLLTSFLTSSSPHHHAFPLTLFSFSPHPPFHSSHTLHSSSHPHFFQLCTLPTLSFFFFCRSSSSPPVPPLLDFPTFSSSPSLSPPFPSSTFFCFDFVMIPFSVLYCGSYLRRCGARYWNTWVPRSMLPLPEQLPVSAESSTGFLRILSSLFVSITPLGLSADWYGFIPETSTFLASNLWRVSELLLLHTTPPPSPSSHFGVKRTMAALFPFLSFVFWAIPVAFLARGEELEALFRFPGRSRGEDICVHIDVSFRWYGGYQLQCELEDLGIERVKFNFNFY